MNNTSNIERIKLTRTEYKFSRRLKEFKMVERTRRIVSEDFYNKFVDPGWTETMRYYGGKEYIEVSHLTTSTPETERIASRATRFTLISPDKKTKFVYEFCFFIRVHSKIRILKPPAVTNA